MHGGGVVGGGRGHAACTAGGWWAKIRHRYTPSTHFRHQTTIHRHRKVQRRRRQSTPRGGSTIVRHRASRRCKKTPAAHTVQRQAAVCPPGSCAARGRRRYVCRPGDQGPQASSSSDIQVDAVWTLGTRPADVPVRSGVLQWRVWRVLASVGQTSTLLQLDRAICMRHTGPPLAGQPNFSSSLSYACLCGLHVRSACSAQDGCTAGWHQQDLDTASAQPRRAPLGACLMTPASTPSTPTS